MSQYKIEERIEYAVDGSVISIAWNIYDENGRIVGRGLESKEIAQSMVEMHKTRNELKKIKTNIIHKNDSKP
ncbi:hypothetical protein G714_04300 [Escherichia coli HVH 39 (4-2679949)]|uniref:hypothetical protein n=1 Tax=Escherichia coli TaxID=562 RepID=UPI0003900709|nr:hypothetical protein [Escherichia coli]EQO38520.1 hypothetical protein G714_04300 [Escherichia coli HVH 39 (4-2679949)]